MAVAIAGCATTGGGLGAEQQVRAEIAAWADAFVAKDIDGLMVHYSEDFTHYEYNNKAGIRDYLQGAVNDGYLDSASIDTSAMVVIVDANAATAGPIELSASFGSAIINLDLRKEAGAWKIIGMNIDLQ
jgi:hypothetical protein